MFLPGLEVWLHCYQRLLPLPPPPPPRHHRQTPPQHCRQQDDAAAAWLGWVRGGGGYICSHRYTGHGRNVCRPCLRSPGRRTSSLLGDLEAWGPRVPPRVPMVLLVLVLPRVPTVRDLHGIRPAQAGRVQCWPWDHSPDLSSRQPRPLHHHQVPQVRQEVQSPGPEPELPSLDLLDPSWDDPSCHQDPSFLQAPSCHQDPSSLAPSCRGDPLTVPTCCLLPPSAPWPSPWSTGRS